MLLPIVGPDCVERAFVLGQRLDSNSGRIQVDARHHELERLLEELLEQRTV
jgi:hypothetical protein